MELNSVHKSKVLEDQCIQCQSYDDYEMCLSCIYTHHGILIHLF